MSELFFTSDPHFSHGNIISYCGRPYESTKEMNEALITNWNERVKPGDEIWLMGDVMWANNPKDVHEILTQLNGKIFYIRGNHDAAITRSISERYFVEEHFYKEMQVGKQRLVLCHYPILSWNKMYQGSWMLHGHCHGNVNHMNENTTRLDVGVDVHNYAPVSYDEVAAILGDKVFEKVDHHG